MLKLVTYLKTRTGCSYGFFNNNRFVHTRKIGKWYKEITEIVEVEHGVVRGSVDEDYKGGTFYSFQGVPYAKAPVTGLRFKAPLSADQWRGIRDASVPGNDAIAYHYTKKGKIVGLEDCLFLNVYTPEVPRADVKILKPVMFWVHGGRFATGSSRRSVYGPELLITGDIVLVTVNYRLGILGFLGMKDPNLQASDNAGVRDIIMALTWVRKCIDKFGGDPNNVTVFGGSAGAAIVHSLILSPLAKGLFHRAILQSGCLLNPWALGSTQTAENIAAILGYKASNKMDVVSFLRSVPVTKLIEAQSKIPVSEGESISPFGILLESASAGHPLLVNDPLDVIKSGNYNKVPLMIGYASREGYFNEVFQMNHFGKFVFDNFEKKIPHYLNVQKGSEIATKIKSLIKEAYYKDAKPSLENIDEYFKLHTDYMILNGVYETVFHHLDHLKKIYFYTLTADTKRNYFKIFNKISRPGTSHGDDIGYLFQSKLLPKLTKNSVEEKIVQRMITLWTNFAKYGNPNGKDNSLGVEWKTAEKENLHCLTIGQELNCGVNTDVNRLKVWRQISDLVGYDKHS